MKKNPFTAKSSILQFLLVGLLLSAILLSFSCRTQEATTITTTITTTATTQTTIVTTKPITTLTTTITTTAQPTTTLTTTITTTAQPTTTPTTTITTTTQPTTTPQGTEKVRIIEHHMSELETGQPVVTGTVKNVTSSWMAVVEVWAKFYDTAGVVLSTANDMTNNDLGPDETWSFVIVYWGPNPENVKSYSVEIGVPN
jgi:hypothetical protein